MIFLNRNIEHTVEFYYDSTIPKNYFIQNIFLKNYFFNKKVNNCLYFSEPESFINELEDNYGIYSTEDNFEFLNYSSFYSFFTNNSVDVPRFFRRTKSVKRKINEITFLKLNNYIMRQGKKYKTLKYLNNTI